MITMTLAFAENPYRYPGSTDPAVLGEWYDNNRSPRNQADLRALQAASAEVFAAADVVAGRHSLGPGEHDWIDLVRPVGVVASLPALLFVHGGRWQLNTSRQTAFWARVCAQHGIAFIGLNFPPLAQARLPAMVEAVGGAVSRVVAQAEALGIDPEALVLAGHSSGAHLALASVLPGPSRATPVWAARLRGLVLLGGMYDLAPLRLSPHQAALAFDEDEAREASPLVTLEQAQAAGLRLGLPPTLVAVGADETVEFLRQSRALHWALQAHLPARWLAIEGTAHFDAALEFNREVSQLRGFVLDQLALGRTFA
jgi:arylformamidase